MSGLLARCGHPHPNKGADIICARQDGHDGHHTTSVRPWSETISWVQDGKVKKNGNWISPRNRGHLRNVG